MSVPSETVLDLSTWKKNLFYVEDSKCYGQYDESLRVIANEELWKFKDSVIEEFDALKYLFLSAVDSFKERHLNSCGNDILIENSEHLIKPLQEDITFLRV